MNFPTVRRGQPEVCEPPWSCEAASMLMVVFDADQAHLQRMVDRVINGPLGRHRFTVAEASFWFSVQRITGFCSTAAVSDGVRYDYGEVTFWVLVLDESGEQHFVAPYVIHEPTVPTAIGRELFGFSKEIGFLDTSPDGSRHEVQVLGHMGAGTTATLQTVAVLKRTGDSPVAELAGLDLLDKANFKRGQDYFKSAPLGFAKLTTMNFPFLFLRQFAAPAGSGCDVQQVVRVPMVVDPGSSPMNADGQWQLALATLKSHPIAADLGVSPIVTSTQSLQLNCTFELPAGAVLT